VDDRHLAQRGDAGSQRGQVHRLDSDAEAAGGGDQAVRHVGGVRVPGDRERHQLTPCRCRAVAWSRMVSATSVLVTVLILAKPVSVSTLRTWTAPSASSIRFTPPKSSPQTASAAAATAAAAWLSGRADPAAPRARLAR